MIWLRDFDYWLFHQLNAVWTNRLFDWALPTLTNLHRVPIVAFGIFPASVGYWIYRRRLAAVKLILSAALLIAATDASTYWILKPLFHRSRPEYSGIPVVLREGHHGRYSFPSNHAANTFAAAAFFGSLYPAARIPLFVMAGIIAYSRVYLGDHFPLDVIGGAIFGSLLGYLGALAYRRWQQRSPLPREE